MGYFCTKCSKVQRIRTKDIAQKAGVSLGTVDRVIHNREGVSKKSREKVLSIMKELGYEPNRYASALASNRSFSFACLIPAHSEGEYWEQVEKGLVDGSREFADLGINLTFFYYDSFDYPSFGASAGKILEGEFNAVIIGPTVKEFTLPFTSVLDGRGIPYIFVDANIEGASPLAYFAQHAIMSGYFTAGIVLPLRERCGERVAVFETSRKNLTGSNQQVSREEGFRKWICDNSSPVSLLKVNLPPERDRNYDAKILGEFFRKNPDIKTGVIFNSRAYAVGEYLRDNSIRDFDLTGYDLLPRNVECLKGGWISRLISQRPHEQGYEAVKALCGKLILHKETRPENLMPIDLLTRDNIDFYFQ